MKKRIFILALLVGMAILFTATAALAGKPQPVGEQLNLYDGPVEFPANTPFHITHGFVSIYEITEPISNSFAFSEMTLKVNGVVIEPDYSETLRVASPEEGWKGYQILYTYNFPEGIEPGEVIFVRQYYFPCLSLLKEGLVSTCEHPTSLIEDPGMMQTRVVTFFEEE